MVRRRRLAARYADRSVAGRLLAEALVAEAALERPVVLALPRGGVPVAAPKSRPGCGAPLGLILVRKIGVPGRSELAMGALAMIDGQLAEFRNEEIVDGLGSRARRSSAARNRERRRARASRRPLSVPRSRAVADATVIVVDDGLATGLDHAGGRRGCPGAGPAAVIVAVPVGAGRPCTALGRSPIWSSALCSRSLHRGRRRVRGLPPAQRRGGRR